MARDGDKNQFSMQFQPIFPMLRRTSVAAAVLGAMGLLAGCGAKVTPSTQTAARVNKEEITVHQINLMLSQQTMMPEHARQAEGRILERLIDRELAAQKAIELKLDREPRVVQAIESARLEVFARAYADKLAEGAARPTPSDIKKYYDDHPALFRDRRIYHLQEFQIEADAGQIETLKMAMPPVKSPDEWAAYLDASGLRVASSQSVRAAEQLPLSALPALARLGEGQSLLNPTPKGAQVVVVRATRLQPVDEGRASRAIEQFLLNENKRKLLSDDLKALRSAAVIEYFGQFAGSAPPHAPDADAAALAADVAASAAATLDANGVNERLSVRAGIFQAADAAARKASGVDTSIVNKGLGLK